eukprot:1158741-Pelagomonas_calceolata.AAC.4
MHSTVTDMGKVRKKNCRLCIVARAAQAHMATHEPACQYSKGDHHQFSTYPLQSKYLGMP